MISETNIDMAYVLEVLDASYSALEIEDIKEYAEAVVNALVWCIDEIKQLDEDLRNSQS